MAVYGSIEELIGNTPLLRLSAVEREYGTKAKLYGKLEYLNPAGSVKDRAALGMIDRAEAEGKLVPGSVIIEPTSGNTGIGLAAIAAVRGYRTVIVMPETMSEERRVLEKAEELAANTENSFIPSQFTNEANAEAHFKTTGPEIWADTYGSVDIFVAGVGTGGTLTGVGKYLKSKRKEIKIVAVEPSDSPVLSGGAPGPHGIQGIGAGFVPEVLDTDVIDMTFTVSLDDAYEAGRIMGRREGVLVGISSGAALYAAVQLAKLDENAGKTIVALLPDTGDRYLSTDMFRTEDAE